jgi:hypothetical protein
MTPIAPFELIALELKLDSTLATANAKDGLTYLYLLALSIINILTYGFSFIFAAYAILLIIIKINIIKLNLI